MKFGKKVISLQAAMSLLVATVVILALAVTGFLISREVVQETDKHLTDKALDIARMVAHSPLVIDALEGKEDDRQIQSFTSEIGRMTQVKFIVVMDMNHIRKSHPDQTKVGKRFVGGDEDKAMAGKEYISVADGTLGKSLRAFEPIRNAAGKQVGVVAVGILMDRVEAAKAQSARNIYIGVIVGVLVGAAGALVLARKVKKILFGLEPFQIAGLLQERNAMLESVREGILAVDHEEKIVVANAEAVRIFQRRGLVGPLVGKNIEEVMPESRLRHVLESGRAEVDQEYGLNGLTLVVNRVPVTVENQVVGAIATFRDKTELKQLAEQLTGVKSYAEALRVQAHEFLNKLHVILGLVHIGEYDKLSSFIQHITDHYQMEVGAVSRLVKEPVLAGFLLSKYSYAREHGVTLHLSGDCPLPLPRDPELVGEMITILGNLIDNGIEAVEGGEKKEISVFLKYDGTVFSCSVQDSGGGIPDEIRGDIFKQGFSTKGKNRGYGLYLVESSVEKLGGTLVVTSDGDGTTFTINLPYKAKDESS
ncbi:DcuS/MalK family sensor histidine kinase [Laceyella putida]|uniref:histidine kinase n=1 Tax=Laceyella putida TaxID=110101 RepID=A0ABW2RH23_9BACL